MRAVTKCGAVRQVRKRGHLPPPPLIHFKSEVGGNRARQSYRERGRLKLMCLGPTGSSCMSLSALAAAGAPGKR